MNDSPSPAFVVSDHARLAMRERGIHIDQVAEVFRNPDAVMPAPHGRQVWQGRCLHHGRLLLLRIVVGPRTEPPTIITVYMTSQFERYERSP
ncbi:MAG: DUF4258 domain-containing protein [Fimbriimonadaceae bacterium]|nr:DUF4258 domain-containing protein [Fimbriimonadaceae bacterium]